MAHKCPRCHEGDLYTKSYLTSVPGIFVGNYNMHDNCPVCGQKYEIEVGFWWGAMYVGYTLSAGALLIAGLIALFVFDLSYTGILTVLIITMLIGFSYNARLSRAIWLNIFVDYDPDAKSLPYKVVQTQHQYYKD